MGEYRFNWHETGEEDFQRWLIPTILADLPREQSRFDELSELTRNWSDVNVTVQINGVEVDPAGFFTSIERNITYLTEREAARLVGDNARLSEIHSVLDTFERVIRREARMALGSLGIDLQEEY